jgi:hypothetical protein
LICMLHHLGCTAEAWSERGRCVLLYAVFAANDLVAVQGHVN